MASLSQVRLCIPTKQRESNPPRWEARSEMRTVCCPQAISQRGLYCWVNRAESVREYCPLHPWKISTEMHFSGISHWRCLCFPCCLYAAHIPGRIGIASPFIHFSLGTSWQGRPYCQSNKLKVNPTYFQDVNYFSHHDMCLFELLLLLRSVH